MRAGYSYCRDSLRYSLSKIEFQPNQFSSPKRRKKCQMCGVHFISQTSLAEIIPLRHALEVAHICITLFKMNMLYMNQQKQQKDAP